MIDLGMPLAPDTAAAAPHSAGGETVSTHDLSTVAPPATPARRWTPQRVVATPAADEHPHGRRVMALVQGIGLEVERLPSCRILYRT